MWLLQTMLLSMSLAPIVSCQLSRPLEDLNKTLSGRLRHGAPLASPCFREPNGTECASIKQGLASSYFRSNAYNGFRHMQGEACVADPDDQCLLDSTTMSAGVNRTCRLGMVSPIYLEVASAQDVLAVFSHAKKHGSALSIKNSAHDYTMRSSRQGSLSLWTRKLRQMTFYESFVPEGCSDDTEPISALVFGSGVNTDEAVSFAHQNGVTFLGASTGSVGASGGWLLNGGHSVLSGAFGLAIDRIVELTIVSPDGKVRTANKCSHPDLFWALRGGGGGSFGVLINATYRTLPESPITSAILLFDPSEDDGEPFLDILASNAVNWTLAGWGGSLSVGATVLANPFLNSSQAQSMLAPATDYVLGKKNGSVIIQSFDTYYHYYAEILNRTIVMPDPISTAMVTTNRLVPQAIFENATLRMKMIKSVLKTQAAGVPVSLTTTLPFLYGKFHAGTDTPLHPSWYSSVWSMNALVKWNGSSSLSERRGAVSLLREISKDWARVTPGGGSYSNEADPWLEDWSSQFWGANYPRLLAIKKSLDPHGSLSCWHCVGWDQGLQGYGCISGMSE